MAAPPPQGAQHAQFCLPPITPEQQYVQKRQGEEVQRDVRTLNTLDTNKPFANLQDAVLRLLPFHLFNSVDPALADLDDTPDHMGADLMASRHDAWEQLVIDKANDLRKRADASSSNITELEARMDRDALSGTRSLDHYAMARLQQEDLRRKIATDKAELQKLLPPAAPAAPAAAAAGGAGGRGASAAGAAAGGLAGLQAAAAAVVARGQPRPQQPVVLPAVQQQLLLQQLQQQQLIAQLPVQQQMALRQHLALQALQQQQQQQQQQRGQQGQLPAGAQQQAAYMQLLQQQALQQQQQQLLAQALAQQQRK